MEYGGGEVLLHSRRVKRKGKESNEFLISSEVRREGGKSSSIQHRFRRKGLSLRLREKKKAVSNASRHASAYV